MAQHHYNGCCGCGWRGLSAKLDPGRLCPRCRRKDRLEQFRGAPFTLRGAEALGVSYQGLRRLLDEGWLRVSDDGARYEHTSTHKEPSGS